MGDAHHVPGLRHDAGAGEGGRQGPACPNHEFCRSQVRERVFHVAGEARSTSRGWARRRRTPCWPLSVITNEGDIFALDRGQAASRATSSRGREEGGAGSDRCSRPTAQRLLDNLEAAKQRPLWRVLVGCRSGTSGRPRPGPWRPSSARCRRIEGGLPRGLAAAEGVGPTIAESIRSRSTGPSGDGTAPS